jgi:hypothetical protein
MLDISTRKPDLRSTRKERTPIRITGVRSDIAVDATEVVPDGGLAGVPVELYRDDTLGRGDVVWPVTNLE